MSLSSICVVLNSLRLKNKKRIIYAPHHTFLSEYNYQMATFAENGKLIQEYALNHPEFEWIFRPHPSFSEKLIQNNILSETEIENYYKKWESIGNIYTESDYYELFATSDCLITDCISFLAEYLPTGKPVIHLRSKKQNCKFNSLLQKITENYYKIYNNTELIKTLDSLLIENNDYLQKKRTDTINLLMVDKNKTAGEKIKDYLIKELHLKA